MKRGSIITQDYNNRFLEFKRSFVDYLPEGQLINAVYYPNLMKDPLEQHLNFRIRKNCSRNLAVDFFNKLNYLVSNNFYLYTALKKSL